MTGESDSLDANLSMNAVGRRIVVLSFGQVVRICSWIACFVANYAQTSVDHSDKPTMTLT